MASSHHLNVGRRLLPATIDELAENDPDRVWASMPQGSSPADGYADITFAVFANAINRMAYYMESSFGPATDFETIGYIGKPDMRYQIIAMAAAKTGFQALFSSHMNSLTGHLNLLDQCSCQLFMSATGVEVSDILTARPMEHLLIPELEVLLDPAIVPPYQYQKSFDEAKDDPFVVLHTSGTTGLPKPVTINHGYVAAVDAQSLLPEVDESTGLRRYRWVDHLQGRLLSPFAPFHALCVTFVSALAVFGRSTIVFGLRDRMMDVGAFAEALRHAKVNSVTASPSLLEQLAESEDGLDYLSKATSVSFSGGVLSQSAAEVITKRVKLTAWWGSTECNAAVQYEKDAEDDWAYISFDDREAGIEWKPVDSTEGPLSQVYGMKQSNGRNEETSAADSDDFASGPNANRLPAQAQMYEAVFVNRAPGKSRYSTQPVFAVFPQLTSWATSDLYQPHPTKPHLWRHAGRTDDLICFANGLKFHPSTTQQKLSTHDAVRSALMCGEGHAQPLVLIELQADSLARYESGPHGREEITSNIWKLVQQINHEAPSVAQIKRTHMVLATRENPFLRAPKGTIQRKLTIKEYERELEECYATYGDKSAEMIARVKDDGVS